MWFCAGCLIWWPYTPGLTSNRHRGQLNDAIPIRDPGFARHERFTYNGYQAHTLSPAVTDKSTDGCLPQTIPRQAALVDILVMSFESKRFHRTPLTCSQGRLGTSNRLFQDLGDQEHLGESRFWCIKILVHQDFGVSCFLALCGFY